MLFQGDEYSWYGIDYPKVLELEHPYCWSGGFSVWQLLPFHRSVLIYIFPSRREIDFERRNHFKVSEIPNLVEYANRKRLHLILPAKATEYTNLEFLKPIFEKCPVTYHPRDIRTLGPREEATELIKFGDKLEDAFMTPKGSQALDYYLHNVSDLDSPKDIINHVIDTYIDLKMLNYDSVADELVSYLHSKPLMGIFLVRCARDLIILPLLDEFRSINVFSYEGFLSRCTWVNQEVPQERFNFPYEIGRVLLDRLTTYFPTDYASYRWYEDNVDTTSIIEAIQDLHRLISVGSGTRQSVESIAELARKLFDDFEKRLHTLKKGIMSAYILTSAILGATVGLIPGIGFLAGLGVAVGSSVITKKVTDFFLERRIPPPMFNIYKLLNRIEK